MVVVCLYGRSCSCGGLIKWSVCLSVCLSPTQQEHAHCVRFIVEDTGGSGHVVAPEPLTARFRRSSSTDCHVELPENQQVSNYFTVVAAALHRTCAGEAGGTGPKRTSQHSRCKITHQLVGLSAVTYFVLL